MFAWASRSSISDEARAPLFVHVGKAGNLQGFLHVIQQILFVDGLGQESEGAAVRGVHRIGNGAVGSQNDDPQSRPAAL
jgi:hypothetical protein